MRMFLMNLLGLEEVLDRRLKLLDREHRREVDQLHMQHQATLKRIEDGKEEFRVEIKQGRKGRYRSFIYDQDGAFLMGSPVNGHDSEKDALIAVNRLFNGKHAAIAA